MELFAGCGGLSLGLESIGGQLILANELSPMAAETFSYNFYNEDLAQKAKEESEPGRTYWLTSNFTEKQLNQRLREDPRTYPDLIGEGYISDLNTKSFKLWKYLVLLQIIH